MLLILRWIHLVAASLWLGGLVFVVLVMRAPVQELGKQTAIEPTLVRFRRRYKGLLIGTVAALAASGVAALVARHGSVDALYVVLLIVKILISVGVIALFWYVAFVREEPLRRAPAHLDATPGAEPSPPVSEQTAEDVDFLFRPQRHQALVQWWIIGATVVALLLGQIVASRGASLAERDARAKRASSPPSAETHE
jgi:uncharacterized membrane protein